MSKALHDFLMSAFALRPMGEQKQAPLKQTTS